MKTEARIFAFLGVFYIPCFLLYGFWSGWNEPVGWVGLTLASGLGFMVAWYLWRTAKDLPERPEDAVDGEIAEQEGAYGHFSPHSWSPLILGGAAGVCALGIAVGWWIFLIGLAIAGYGVVAWVFEYYKGPHAI